MRKKYLIPIFVCLSLHASATELTCDEQDLLTKFLDPAGGSWGVGFVGSHTYLAEYQLQVLQTKDIELQKAYLLWRLASEIERNLWQLEQNRIRLAKEPEREMTSEERTELVKKTRKHIAIFTKMEGARNETEPAATRTNLTIGPSEFRKEYSSELDRVALPGAISDEVPEPFLNHNQPTTP